MILKKLWFILIILSGLAVPVVSDTRYSIHKGLHPRQSCTIIYAADDKIALAGNNEDWNNPFTKIWFLPAEPGKYGRIYFGFDSFMPQGGMNDQGLFFDAAVAKAVEVPRDPGKPAYRGSLILKAMAECDSVDDVLALFQEYNVSGSWNGHYLVGDRFGNSAIIEPCTVIRKKGRHQIATNFYQSKTAPEKSNCERYRIASDWLEKSGQISVELFSKILDAVHYESESGAETLYSNICDLKRGLIHLYHFHNFQNAVSIDLKKELAKGTLFYDLPSLFPETFASVRYAAQKREHFEKMLKERGINQNIGPGVFDRYAGKFRVPAEMGLAEDSSIEIKTIDNHLFMIIKMKYNLKIYKLYPRSETEFFHIYSNGENFFTIFQSEKGPVGKFDLILEEDGQTFMLKRIDS